MNWYKNLKTAINFTERNDINHKIQYLEDILKKIKKISKTVFQSGSDAKKINYDILSSVKITTYPKIRDILIKSDDCALDSPWKFKKSCEKAIFEIKKIIEKLKEDRKDLLYDKKEKDKHMKGLNNG